MEKDLMEFDMPAGQSSIIKVIGVGGGGSNAVNHMYSKGIKDVNFVVCNTDAQALTNSPVSVKIQLGESLTEGRGAGNKPEIGREAALENLNEIKEILSKNTKMVFITAGMGGGTGTGAAPVIAQTAKEMGILTVAIVTIPFRFEGQQKIDQAIKGIDEIKHHVDSLLVINNQKLREVYGDLKLAEAFARADDVLTKAAKGIAEIITVHGHINVDFADVETVMQKSGVAILGSATASGEDRAINAIEGALSSPLLNNNDITGAKSILLNITAGKDELSMDEVGEITDYLNHAGHKNALIIWGAGTDESLESSISVTVIATGFGTNSIPEYYTTKPHVNKIPLRDSHSNASQINDDFQIKEKDISETQQRIEFSVDDKAEEYVLYDENQPGTNPENDIKSCQERVQRLKKAHEQQAKTAAYNSKSDNETIEELENQPAYLRKQIQIKSEKPSEETETSRYKLSEDEDEGGPKLREDNSYLHDNVD